MSDKNAPTCPQCHAEIIREIASGLPAESRTREVMETAAMLREVIGFRSGDAALEVLAFKFLAERDTLAERVRVLEAEKESLIERNATLRERLRRMVNCFGPSPSAFDAMDTTRSEAWEAARAALKGGQS